MVLLWITVSEEIRLLFSFKDRIEFCRATRGQGWMADSKKSSGGLDSGLLGGSPIVRGPLGVYPRLCLLPTILTFHQHKKKIICHHRFAITPPCSKIQWVSKGGIKAACDWIQKWRKKELKWEITCSFHQQWLHWSMAEALFLHKVRFSVGMKKVYVSVEEYVFMSAQMLHVLHTWRALYLTSSQFIIIIPIVSLTVILDYVYATF